ARVAGPARLAPHDALSNRDPGVHHRGRGALLTRPTVRGGRVPQPFAATDEARSGSHGDLRLRPAPQAGVGEEPRDRLAVQHLPPRGPAPGPDRRARAGEPARGTLPGPP